MLDGRLYNYPKPGAVEFRGKDSATQAQDAARAAADAIHGLGRVCAAWTLYADLLICRQPATIVRGIIVQCTATFLIGVMPIWHIGEYHTSIFAVVSRRF